MKPMPITRRSGGGTHWLDKALFISLNMLISLIGSRRARVLSLFPSTDAAGSVDRLPCEPPAVGGGRGHDDGGDVGRRRRPPERRQRFPLVFAIVAQHSRPFGP